MRILHVVRGLKNSSGTTHIVGPLSEAQAQLGCDVSVFFVEQGGEVPVAPDPGLVTSRCFPASLPLYHPGVSLPFAKAIERAVRAFDVVHIHAIWNFPTWWTMRAADRAGAPYVVAPQGSLEPWAMRGHGWHKRLYARRIEIPLMRRAAFMQALSPAEADQIRAAGIDAPVVVAPNGVRPEWFEGESPPLAAQLGLAAGGRTLLSLSRLNPKKGIDILIRGFARARDLDDVTLVIAGHDAGTGYRDVLEQLAAQLGLGRRILFVGELAGSRKYEALIGADAFALISHSEGLPVACIEAMAARLPVIVTPGCNLPEVAEREAGLLVPTDPEEVALALRTILNCPDAARRMGVNGSRLVEERFTWRSIARQLCDAYAEAIRTKSREPSGRRRPGNPPHAVLGPRLFRASRAE